MKKRVYIGLTGPEVVDLVYALSASVDRHNVMISELEKQEKTSGCTKLLNYTTRHLEAVSNLLTRVTKLKEEFMT